MKCSCNSLVSVLKIGLILICCHIFTEFMCALFGGGGGGNVKALNYFKDLSLCSGMFTLI